MKPGRAEDRRNKGETMAVSLGWLLWLTEKPKTGGAGDRVRGWPGAGLMGPLELRRCGLWGREGAGVPLGRVDTSSLVFEGL